MIANLSNLKLKHINLISISVVMIKILVRQLVTQFPPDRAPLHVKIT